MQMRIQIEKVLPAMLKLNYSYGNAALGRVRVLTFPILVYALKCYNDNEQDFRVCINVNRTENLR